MTDAQLVSALIASYKQRGIDLSHLLDDPVFTSLPIRSRIAALQENAAELEKGISGNYNKQDLKEIGTDAAWNGFQGAMMGLPTGAALMAASGGKGITPTQGAIVGAAILGLSGALVGALKGSEGVGYRRGLKTSLRAVSEAPSPINALTTLTHSHSSEKDRALRHSILERITGDMMGIATQRLPVTLEEIHNNKLSQTV